MATRIRTFGILAACVLWVLGAEGLAWSQERWRLIFPEQRRMAVRPPTRLPKARLPRLPDPPTVSDSRPDLPSEHLSLDDAIRTALANSEVVRVLAGVTATSSGRTIYDPAITNTGIDQARGPFDPKVEVLNDFNRRETPRAGFDPGDPSRVIIGGEAVEDYGMSTGVSKATVTGGSLNLGVNANPARSNAVDKALNPETSSSLDLSFTQPLLQGAGRPANLAPIVLARIDTERSFFQLKDSVQRLVLGVIEAYRALVFARIEVWVRQQQVTQGEQALLLARNKLKAGKTDSAEVEQARSALADFQASAIAAEADLLQREAALRDILGLPPSDAYRLVPVTPLDTERLEIDWASVVGLAEDYRPDLIEWKLILEADEQRMLLARNQALPRVDASALYRWNGLEGRTPDRRIIASRPGEFTGWQLGVNFSVPLGLRQARAEMRQQELTIMRDRANLQQGLHQAVHQIATSYRNVAQYYAQYEAFKVASEASRVNLILQWFKYQSPTSKFPVIYLDVLQAITSWGNARSAEAQALTQYNAELANLEFQSGTILESHGIRFFEERYGSIGPLGRMLPYGCYPRDYRPGPNVDQYPATSEPAEKAFGLEPPVPQLRGPSGDDRSSPSLPRPGPAPIRPTPAPRRPGVTFPEPVPPPAPDRGPRG